MVGGAAAFVRATGALAHSASTGHLALQGIGMRVLPPPLCDRSAFRQLVSIDLASNCITALPLGIFMWLLQLQSLILDRNKITSFPFCLFLKTHVVIHDAPPAPPSAHSAANLTAFPCARPLKISCQHNPLKDPFVRMARGDAAGPHIVYHLHALARAALLLRHLPDADSCAVWLHVRLQVCEALWMMVNKGVMNLEGQGLQVSHQHVNLLLKPVTMT
jgi:hypothetical protein